MTTDRNAKPTPYTDAERAALRMQNQRRAFDPKASTPLYIVAFRFALALAAVVAATEAWRVLA